MTVSILVLTVCALTGLQAGAARHSHTARAGINEPRPPPATHHQDVSQRKVTIHPANATCGSLRDGSTIRPRRHLGLYGDPVYRQVAALQRATHHSNGAQPEALFCVTTPCPDRQHPVKHVTHSLTRASVRIGGADCSTGPRDGPRDGGGGRRCAVKLDHVVTPSAYTVTFWARGADHQAAGTLMEIGEMSISVMSWPDERPSPEVRVTFPNCTYDYQLSEWSAGEWNHVAIQTDRSSRHLVIRVYINGRAAGLTTTVGSPPQTFSHRAWVYLGKRRGPAKTDLGDNYHTFDGEVGKVKLYDAVLTERELYQLYSGVFPPVPGPFNECLCPEKYPFLNREDHGSSCCASMDCHDPHDMGKIVRQTFGLSPQSILVGPEAIVDGAIGPYVWISTPGVTSVSLDVDLGTLAEIACVDIVLRSPPPEEAVVLYFRQRRGWMPWHYFTFNCSDFSRARHDVGRRQPTCQQLATINSEQTVWNLTWRRPSGVAVSEDAETDAVRVAMLGLPSHAGRGRRERLQYHVVSEIKIIERSTRQQKTKPSIAKREGSYRDNRLPAAPPREPVRHHKIREGSTPEVHRRRMKRQSGQPEVFEVVPSVGPETGHLMTIHGANFGSNVTVAFQDELGTNLKCACLAEIEDVLGCNTGERISCYVSIPPGPATLIGVPLQVHVVTADGTPAVTNGNHTYTPQPSPIIHDVFPKKTFISGGIYVQVLGEHLTSFTQPRLLLSVTFPDRSQPSGTPTVGPPCRVLSDSEMFCRTPPVFLPSIGLCRFCTPQRKRRSLRRTERLSEGSVAEGASAVGKERVRRQDNGVDNREFYLNDNSRNIDIGVLLGGATVTNITKDSDDVMLVARDPVIFDYADDGIHVSRMFPPHNEDVLELKGEFLDTAATLEDYEVTVGQEPCGLLDLSDEFLTCWLPDLKNATGKLTKDGTLQVMVAVGNLEFSPGYVRYLFSEPPPEPEVNAPKLPAIIGAVVAAVLLVVIALIIGVCCWRRRRKDSKADAVDHGPDYTTLLSLEKTILDLLEEGLRQKIAECTIPPTQLSRSEQIGQGNFGKVFLGRLSLNDEGTDRNQDVAVKTIRGKGVTLRQLSEFLEEATIMKDFDHPNVLSLLGVVIEDNRPYVLLPYMANGDLRAYISNDPQKEFHFVELLDLGAQVSNGMTYLSGHNFVHRDLRAVNCMVDDKGAVKVGDFGLARDMHYGDYYKIQDQMRPLPVKWMAPEALAGGVFSSRSDVWSYGVVMWELLTRGLKPYAAIDNYDMKNYLDRGYRLPKPDVCTDKVYGMMQKCWSAEPHKRPTFAEVCTEVKNIIEEIKTSGQRESRATAKEEYLVLRRPESLVSVPNEYVQRPQSAYQEPEVVVLHEIPDSDQMVDAQHDEETAFTGSHDYENSAYVHGEDDPVSGRHDGSRSASKDPTPLEESSSRDVHPHDPSKDNPYFVNPPISDDYASPEGKEKLEKSVNLPRGLLVKTFPEEETQRDDTKTGGSGLESGISKRMSMPENQEDDGREEAGEVVEPSDRGSAPGSTIKRGPDYANQPSIAVRRKDQQN